MLLLAPFGAREAAACFRWSMRGCDRRATKPATPCRGRCVGMGSFPVVSLRARKFARSSTNRRIFDAHQKPVANLRYAAGVSDGTNSVSLRVAQRRCVIRRSFSAAAFDSFAIIAHPFSIQFHLFSSAIIALACIPHSPSAFCLPYSAFCLPSHHPPNSHRDNVTPYAQTNCLGGAHHDTQPLSAQPFVSVESLARLSHLPLPSGGGVGIKKATATYPVERLALTVAFCEKPQKAHSTDRNIVLQILAVPAPPRPASTTTY